MTVIQLSCDAVSASWFSKPEIHNMDVCILVCGKICAASLRSGPTVVVDMALPLRVQLSTAVVSTLVAMYYSGAMSGKKCGGE